MNIFVKVNISMVISIFALNPTMKNFHYKKFDYNNMKDLLRPLRHCEHEVRSNPL